MNRKDSTAQTGSVSAGQTLWRYLPLVVFVVALAARLLVLGQLSNNYPGFDNPSVDSRWHLLWARQLAEGGWIGNSIFYRAPLYPYLLGIFFTIFGENLWLIRIGQAVLGSVTAVLVFLLGRRLFDRRIGAAAGLIWAFWATTIYYESELLIPVLIIPLNLWAIYRLAGAVQQKRWNIRDALITGVIFGLSAIARPNILIVAAALVPWVFWRFPVSRRRHKSLWLPICAFLAGLSLPIAPVTIYNAMAGGDFVPISYQGGINLYLGNNPESDGLTMILPEVRLDETVDWTEFVRTTDSIAMVISGKRLKPSEISNFWMGRTIESVMADPVAEILLLGKKLFYFWSGFENGDNTDIYRHAEYSRLLKIGLWHWYIWFPFGIISALGLWGIWSTRREGRAVELGSLFVLVYMLSVVGFLVTARHRLPVVPVVIIFAAAGTARLFTRLKKRGTVGRKILAAGSVAGLLVIVNLNLFDVGLTNPIQYHYQQGIIYDRQGDYSRAIEQYQKALAIWPNHFPSRHNLAYDFYRQGDYQSAIDNFTWAIGARPGNAEAFNNLGLAYRAAGDTTNALGSFRLARKHNPRLIESFLNSGDTYRAGGMTGEAEKYYLQGLAVDSTYGPILNHLGLLYIENDRRDEAERVLLRGTILNPKYPFCWLNLGALYLETGRPLDALTPLETFLRLRPRQMDAKFNLAVAYTRTGQIFQAKKTLEEILALQPQHAAARALLEQIKQQEK